MAIMGAAAGEEGPAGADLIERGVAAQPVISTRPAMASRAATQFEAWFATVAGAGFFISQLPLSSNARATRVRGHWCSVLDVKSRIQFTSISNMNCVGVAKCSINGADESDGEISG